MVFPIPSWFLPDQPLFVRRVAFAGVLIGVIAILVLMLRQFGL